MPSQTDNDRFRKEIFVDHVYDAGITKKHYKCVVDLGCNVGHFIDYIKDRAGEIYGVEMMKESYDECKAKFNQSNIHLYNIAVGSPSDAREVFRGDSIIYNNVPIGTTKVISLEQFFTDNNIKKVDLLKCDIEGSEREIFSSTAMPVLSKIIDAIVGEVHSGVDLKTPLEQAGYKYFQGNVAFWANKL